MRRSESKRSHRSRPRSHESSLARLHHIVKMRTSAVTRALRQSWAQTQSMRSASIWPRLQMLHYQSRHDLCHQRIATIITVTIRDEQILALATSKLALKAI